MKMDSGYRSSTPIDDRNISTLLHSNSWAAKEFRERYRGNVRRKTVHSNIYTIKMEDEEDFGSDSIQSHGPTLKDQEHLVQDLKKENFDLKLRLYMETKKNESSDSKLEEYERQIAQLLDRLEESSNQTKLLERDLKDTRVREKTLVTKQKRLEIKCTEQNDQIQNLSMDVARLQSMSMQDLSSLKHSTPLRHAKSEFQLQPHNEDEDDYIDEENDDLGYSDDESKPLSPVPPMIRQQSTESKEADDIFHEESENVNSNPKIEHIQNVTIHQRNNSTRSYNNQYTPVKNFYTYELPDGRPVAAAMPRTIGESDNVGIVRPNNSRIGIDANINTYIVEKDEGKKKKKKGLMRIFKMCGGGKSSKVQRNASVYHKSEFKARPIPEERPGDFQL